MDALVDFLLDFSGMTHYIVVFVILLACGLGLPIPEDITLFAAGLISYYGAASVWGMIAVGMAGVMIGDSFMFYLGSHYGRKLTKKWFFAKIFPPERLDLVKKKLHQQGNKVIFLARFMPGLRAPIFFTCGTLHVPFRVFFFYDGLAALISVPAIVYTVYYFGDELDRVIGVIKNVQYGIVFFTVGLVLLLSAKWYLGRRKLKKSR